jgi:hypothetical protein
MARLPFFSVRYVPKGHRWSTRGIFKKRQQKAPSTPENPMTLPTWGKEAGSTAAFFSLFLEKLGRYALTR